VNGTVGGARDDVFMRPLATSLASALCVAAVGSVASPLAAGIVYDESVSGDFSDDRFQPTLLTLEAGVNTLTGTFGGPEVPDVLDLDYVTITVPVGYVLDSFVVLDANVGGAFSFVGIQAGPIVTIPWDWTSVESPLLGWAHFGTASIGSDLLPEMGAAPGAVGFTGPLPAGTYALWIMELDASQPYSYSFGIGLTAVPAAPAFVAFAGVAWPRRRRGA
jgi:hypothetical protein